MRIRNLLIVLAIAATPAVASAQVVCTASPCDAVMTATGNVASSVTWTQLQALSFGSMTGATTIAPSAGTSGRMQLDHNQDVTVSVIFPTDLADANGNLVPVTAPTCASGTTATPPATPTTLACTGGTLAATADATTYVYIGATATPGATLPAGVYSGTITFRAVYTAF